MNTVTIRAKAFTGEPPTEPGPRLAFAFALALSGLHRYDRCTKCGRISWLAKSWRHPRKLVSVDTSRLEQRAAEFEEWAARQAT